MLFAIVGSSTVLPSAFVPRPHQAMFFIFFHLLFLALLLVLLFLIFLMFIAIAIAVVAVVAVLAVARCQPHLATLAKVWGAGAESCQAGLGSLGFMATLHCKTGATFSALLCSTVLCPTPAWALHLKAVINNLITDFVSVRHKQH